MVIQIKNQQKKIKIDKRRLRSVLRKILKHLSCEDRELSIIFMDNEGILEINRCYLNRNKATNVISFSMSEGEFGDINPMLLGDIIISVERAAEEACKNGLHLNDEIDYLIIHGLLHLLGYNHEDTTKAEEKRMREKEKEVFCYIKGYSFN